MSALKNNYTVRELIYGIFMQFFGGLLVVIVVAVVNRLGFGKIAIGLVAIIVLALLVFFYVFIRRMELAMYWLLAAVITLVCYALLIVGYQFLNDKHVLIPALWILVGVLLPVHLASVTALLRRWCSARCLI